MLVTARGKEEKKTMNGYTELKKLSQLQHRKMI